MRNTIVGLAITGGTLLLTTLSAGGCSSSPPLGAPPAEDADSGTASSGSSGGPIVVDSGASGHADSSTGSAADSGLDSAAASDAGAGSDSSGAVDSSIPSDAGAGASLDSSTASEASSEGGGSGCSSGQSACGSSCVDLTSDPANCGACSHSCGTDAQGAPASCAAGQCQPVTWITTTQPVAIGASETAVYWEDAAGSVMSAPAAGSPVSTLFAAPVTDAGASTPGLVDSTHQMNLVIDSTRVYWAVNPSYDVTAAYVQSVLFDGTSPSTFDPSPVADSDRAIAIDAANLYVATYKADPQGGSCPDLGITVVPLSHGPVTTLDAPCWVVQIAVDASQNVYWTDLGPPPAYTHPAVMMQPASSTTATVIAPAVNPYGVAVYAGSVYWTDGANVMVSPVGAVGADGGGASVLSTSTQPLDLVVDASGVYWIDSGNAVMTAPLAGGTARLLAQQQPNATALATTSGSVFWVNQGTAANGFADGAVMKLAK